MIRLSRLADYAVVLMSQAAREPAAVHNALSLAEATHLPAPTVSKILAMLARDGLLESSRGREGGYRLAHPANQISADAIIAAVDGPIALTVCVDHGHGASQCEIEALCPSRANWQRINDAVRGALRQVMLADLAAPPALTFDQALQPLRDLGQSRPG